MHGLQDMAESLVSGSTSHSQFRQSYQERRQARHLTIIGIAFNIPYLRCSLRMRNEAVDSVTKLKLWTASSLWNFRGLSFDAELNDAIRCHNVPLYQVRFRSPGSPS